MHVHVRYCTVLPRMHTKVIACKRAPHGRVMDCKMPGGLKLRIVADIAYDRAQVWDRKRGQSKAMQRMAKSRAEGTVGGDRAGSVDGLGIVYGGGVDQHVMRRRLARVHADRHAICREPLGDAQLCAAAVGPHCSVR